MAAAMPPLATQPTDPAAIPSTMAAKTASPIMRWHTPTPTGVFIFAFVSFFLAQRQMAMSINWQRQFVILLLAACFAIYWTGKQGLWDALRGTSPVDRHWNDAKQALIR